ncbi:MAG: LysR family transcriptional regulator [Thermodesulfobacteriota bacterium]
MDIHFKLWLEENGRVLFGEGRQELLRAVARSGSLAAAARDLNMSYRAAWGRIKASEERLGFPLVERTPEGRRAVRLTEKARRLMERYQELEDQARALVEKARKEVAREMAGLRK